MLLHRAFQVSAFVLFIGIAPPACAQCSPLLDLDGNGTVDSQDMFAANFEGDLIQLHACLDIPRGDIDADSQTAFRDFLVLASNYSKEDQQLTVADGDANLDGRVDIRDYAILSINFAASSYSPEPVAVEPSIPTLSIDSSDHIVVSGELELGGISFRSDSGQLDEATDSAPFMLTLSNTSNEIMFGNLGSTVRISGEVATSAKVKPGTNINDIYAEWFDFRSYEVYSSAEPNLDCNDDGTVDQLDLSCICATRGVDLLIQELGLPAGDVDGDGEVALADFLVLSENYLQEVDEYADGDTNCDGRVTFADFITISANFGRTSADVGGGTQAAPEPQGHRLLVLVFAGVVISSCNGRFRRS